MQRLMTVAEVAAMCRENVSTVRRWIGDGLIPAIRLPGGTYRIPREEAEKLVAVAGGGPVMDMRRKDAELPEVTLELVPGNQAGWDRVWRWLLSPDSDNENAPPVVTTLRTALHQ